MRLDNRRLLVIQTATDPANALMVHRLMIRKLTKAVSKYLTFLTNRKNRNDEKPKQPSRDHPLRILFHHACTRGQTLGINQLHKPYHTFDKPCRELKLTFVLFDPKHHPTLPFHNHIGRIGGMQITKTHTL